MNVLLLMTVHGKLVSYFLLKVEEGPQETSPWARAVEHWLCRMLCGGEPESRDPARKDPYEMCQGWLEVECWEQPAGVKGTRGGLAPALGQPEDPEVSASPSGLVLEVGCPSLPCDCGSSQSLPHLWGWALFFLSFFPLPSFLPLFLSSLVFVVVVIKDTWMFFIWFSKEAFNNILLYWVGQSSFSSFLGKTWMNFLPSQYNHPRMMLYRVNWDPSSLPRALQQSCSGVCSPISQSPLGEQCFLQGVSWAPNGNSLAVYISIYVFIFKRFHG